MTIDLHGFSVDDAIATLMNALFEFNLNSHAKLEIITGKGEYILFNEVRRILEQENYEYEELTGKIIVYRNEDEFEI